MTDLTTVYHARDFVDAQLLAGLLESEGLHPTVPGALLNDEFGVAARAAGTSGTAVMVPATEAERARDIVAAWEEERD